MKSKELPKTGFTGYIIKPAKNAAKTTGCEQPPIIKCTIIDWHNPSVPSFAFTARINFDNHQFTLYRNDGIQKAVAPNSYALLGYPNGEFELLDLKSPEACEYYNCDAKGVTNGSKLVK